MASPKEILPARGKADTLVIKQFLILIPNGYSNSNAFPNIPGTLEVLQTDTVIPFKGVLYRERASLYQNTFAQGDPQGISSR